MRSRAPGPKFSTMHVGDADQLLQHFLALGGLGVEGERALVGVQHGEVERVRIGDVAELGARHVA